MTFSKESNEWLILRGNTGNWFSKRTLDWHGSRIYWNTLVKSEDDWLFISSEDNFNKTAKLFSIRKINKDFGIETLEWQTLPDLKAAKSKLKEILATNPCIYCDAPVRKDVWLEESKMCLECSHLFYDHVINPYNPETFPKNKLKAL
jgi:hypothetical protein